MARERKGKAPSGRQWHGEKRVYVCFSPPEADGRRWLRNRRNQFCGKDLRQSGQILAGLAGGVALPQFVPRGVLAATDQPGANDRIGVACIGCGRRGRQLLGIPKEGQFVAFADVYLSRAEELAKKHEARAYQDYRQLLEDKCHLGNIARWVGHRLRWDPERELFPDDPEANAYLERPMRKPYQLPEEI